MATIVAAVICKSDDGRILLIQRNRESQYPHMWCLPGGKAETSELIAYAAQRELYEEVGMVVDADQLVALDVVAYADLIVYVFGYKIEKTFQTKLEESFVGSGWFSLEELGSLNVMHPVNSQSYLAYLLGIWNGEVERLKAIS